MPREILETRYADTVRRYAACGIDITRKPMLVAPAPHTSLGGNAGTEVLVFGRIAGRASVLASRKNPGMEAAYFAFK